MYKKLSTPTENNNMDDKSKELYDAALPLLEFMNKHYCPMDIAVLTEGKVEVYSGSMGVPLPIRD